jgi:hypothetical protein
VHQSNKSQGDEMDTQHNQNTLSLKKPVWLETCGQASGKWQA